MFYDCHTHSTLSFDSETTMTELVRAAREKGLSGICFTDHLDLDYPGYDDVIIDADDYARRYAEADKTGLEVLRGIEVGYQPHTYERQEQAVSAIGWLDHVINSVHIVMGEDIYLPEVYARHSRDELYTAYLRTVYESVCAPITWTALGHLGYVGRISTYEADKRDIVYDEARDVIDAILKRVIDTDRALELNTRVFSAHPLPHMSVLKRYVELGGKLICLGSDAHNGATVGNEFDLAAQAVASLGLKELCFFRQRKPVLYPIK